MTHVEPDVPVDVATALCEQGTQPDPDLALAKLLQEQEHAWFMMNSGMEGEAFPEDVADGEGSEADGTAAAESGSAGHEDGEDGSSDLDMAVHMQHEEYRRHMRLILNMMGHAAADAVQLPGGINNVDIEDMTYEQLQELGEAIGKVQVGVSQQRMSQLKSGTYEEVTGKRLCTDAEPCTVCQQQFEEDDRVLKLPCEHVYHFDCIQQWLQSSKLCPICSTAVED